MGLAIGDCPTQRRTTRSRQKLTKTHTSSKIGLKRKSRQIKKAAHLAFAGGSRQADQDWSYQGSAPEKLGEILDGSERPPLQREGTRDDQRCDGFKGEHKAMPAARR